MTDPDRGRAVTQFDPDPDLLRWCQEATRERLILEVLRLHAERESLAPESKEKS